MHGSEGLYLLTTKDTGRGVVDPRIRPGYGTIVKRLGDGHEARVDATQIVVRVRLRQLGDPLPIRQPEPLDSQLAARD